MKQKRAYRYRFHPTYKQEQLLARPFGCVRSCYNWALHLEIQAYRERGKRLGYGDLSARFTLLKQQPETIWLNEVSCVPLLFSFALNFPGLSRGTIGPLFNGFNSFSLRFHSLLVRRCGSCVLNEVLIM